jgi:imidazoleglycerol-phosphate dehydratase
MRKATISRETKETKISLSLTLDGKGVCRSRSGVAFLDHMLDLTARHGVLDITLDAKGDLEVDTHHTVEDVGIVLGQAVRQAIGEGKGIRRYGWAMVPMDEALATVVLDLSGRPYFSLVAPPLTGKVGAFAMELLPEFFQAFANNAGANLHIKVEGGKNRHHIAEAAFKGFAKALDQAVTVDPRLEGAVPSTKGTIG